MPVLIVKNEAAEGPGTIAHHLRELGEPFTILEPENVRTVDSLRGFDTLVVLGGPMAVYEMDRLPLLRDAERLVRRAVDGGMKVLGICLGAQLIAHVLGAGVYRGHGEEAGWLDVELTEEGAADRLMGALAEGTRDGRFPALHWHGDTFDLPAGADWLARSDAYENQAFRYGERVYALQFHIEVTKDMVREWFAGRPGARRIAAATEALYPDYLARAMGFYRKFFNGGFLNNSAAGHLLNRQGR